MNALCTDVIPIVVTYQPDEKILASVLNTLLSQVQTVILVDNGSSINLKKMVMAANNNAQGRIILLALAQNFGLGKAYNLGIAKAHELAATYVLLMDQDSIPESEMVRHLRSCYQTLSDQNLQVAAIGACYKTSPAADYSNFVQITRFGIARKHCNQDNTLICADFVISSGSLISLNALNTIGGMDETLFIDHIDTEWCLRAKSMGYVIYGSCQAKMLHTLGSKQSRIWWGRWRSVAYHQPFRYYYMFRNSVLLWQRAYIPTGWKRADKLRILHAFFFFTLFSPNRIKNVVMMINGLIDGFKGKTGKLIDPKPK